MELTLSSILVDGYTQEASVSLDYIIPKCIRVLIGNFYGLVSAEVFEKCLLNITVRNDADLKIFDSICRKIGPEWNGEDMINDMLNSLTKMDYIAKTKLLIFARLAINQFQSGVVKLVIKRWIELATSQQKNVAESSILMEILILGVNDGFHQIVELIFSDEYLDYIIFKPRPEFLLNALRKRDDKMIKIVLKGMGRKKNYFFVCDDVFKECVKMDHIECVQFIIEHGWFKPKEYHLKLAQRYYGAIHVWLSQRRDESIGINWQ